MWLKILWRKVWIGPKISPRFFYPQDHHDLLDVMFVCQITQDQKI